MHRFNYVHVKVFNYVYEPPHACILYVHLVPLCVLIDMSVCEVGNVFTNVIFSMTCCVIY